MECKWNAKGSASNLTSLPNPLTVNPDIIRPDENDDPPAIRLPKASIVRRCPLFPPRPLDGMLANGKVLNGTIDDPVESDQYTFEGQAKQTVTPPRLALPRQPGGESGTVISVAGVLGAPRAGLPSPWPTPDPSLARLSIGGARCESRAPEEIWGFSMFMEIPYQHQIAAGLVKLIEKDVLAIW